MSCNSWSSPTRFGFRPAGFFFRFELNSSFFFPFACFLYRVLIPLSSLKSLSRGPPPPILVPFTDTYSQFLNIDRSPNKAPTKRRIIAFFSALQTHRLFNIPVHRRKSERGGSSKERRPFPTISSLAPYLLALITRAHARLMAVGRMWRWFEDEGAGWCPQ